MRFAKSLCAAVVALSLASCEKNNHSSAPAPIRDDCQDKICVGDTPPAVGADEIVRKLGGRYYAMPRTHAYGLSDMAFWWPSKTPVGQPLNAEDSSKKPRNFGRDGIHLHFRSSQLPTGPWGYALITLAEKNGWIESRKTVRPGLEQLSMKHVIGPNGHYIDHVTYYVATDLRDSNGEPPLATCNHDNPDGWGGSAFMWRPDIVLTAIFLERHCKDLPEIHQELARVLASVRELNK